MPEKTNYCTPKGECTVPDQCDERSCMHGKLSAISGFCIYRVMFADKCLSPFALIDARKSADMERGC